MMIKKSITVQVVTNSFLFGMAKTLDIGGLSRPYRVTIKKNENIAQAWKHTGDAFRHSYANVNQNELELTGGNR